MLLQVKTSEPRDALQSERTCLSLVRFSTTLFVTSFGIHLNFKLNTSKDSSPEDDVLNSILSKWISYLMVGLSFVFLLVTGVSYYVTINRYRSGSINNFGFNNSINSVVMGVLMLCLLGLNVLLLVDGYIEK